MIACRLGITAVLLALSGAAAPADEPSPPPQPGAAQSETPRQACERCRKERKSCKDACAGPSGDQVPSDSCLDKCDNAYWRCIPPGHGCD
ncbi:MAG TPA: hypothetical protein VMT17_09110 [Anaeromyxobacteraceae bacterium]|nr:hypothetical protein [Anaeromyxobacteraceae bacterium]